MKKEARPTNQIALNYDKEKEYAKKFLMEFRETTNPRDDPKYVQEIQKIVNKQSTDLKVTLEDLEEFFRGDEYKHFLKNIKNNTKRYLNMFTEVANSMEIDRTTAKDEEEEFDDHLNTFRMENLERLKNSGHNETQINGIKRILQKRFDVFIVPGPNYKKKQSKLRDLKADMIGSLVNIKAIVVRTTEVSPLMDLACYICEHCSCESYVKVNSSQFTPPSECNSDKCRINKIKGNLVQNFAMSQFTPFQEIKIQETSEETPVGSVPRTFTLYARGNNVRKCGPGDIINCTGTFLTKVGPRKFGTKDALMQETYIEAMDIIKTKNAYNDIKLSEDDIKQLKADGRKENIMEKLIKSVAPEIYGMDDVKKALLVMLTGGSTVVLPDGMKIRGDLNMALIGDPGVAKSQLLKYISNLTPRGVYTTGRGSTGAGLTASISRDPITMEITLEGGALVLADMGVCCIDEFDKMNETDRTSIHEVMEQQTISLAKAGITTSLNARTSILVAANPLYGRYDRNISAHANINLPHSLLSRFDLMFILLDKHDTTVDNMLADHIAGMHQGHSVYRDTGEIFRPEYLRNYVALAKTFNPTIGPELHDYITAKYVEKRKKNSEPENSEQDYVTPRTLLAMIRLSQGIAKLRFSNEVCQADIDQAIDLVDKAQAALHEKDDQITNIAKGKSSKSGKILRLIKDIAKKEEGGVISFAAIEQSVIGAGLTTEDLAAAISFYEKSGMLVVNEERSKISLIN